VNEDILRAPISDQQATALISEAAFTELADQITATTWQRGRHRMGRAVLAAALAIMIVTAAVLSVPHPKASGEALAFTTSQGYTDVIVRDPYASPALYRAEFAAHHLDITLRLVPGSPSVVGTLVYGGGDGIGIIRQAGVCSEPGGGACVIGVRIPIGFRGGAELVFARAARAGEHYDATGSVMASGEAMDGLAFRGHTVAQVRAALARRHVSVAGYSVYLADGGTAARRSVPGSWYVMDATPWAPGQVLMLVSSTGTVPRQHCGQICPVPARNP
jgi:hypothetical protein